MSKNTLKNFSLKKSFELEDVSKVIWINDGSKHDLEMKLVETSLVDFDKTFLDKMEKSWDSLKERAQENFPKDGPFVFYNSKVLNWEGLSHDFYENNTVDVSTEITYKTIASIRSDQDLYNDLDKKNKPCAFVIVSIFVTSDNKLVFGKRMYYGDWPYSTYETTGGFLKQQDFTKESLIKIAADKIREDFENTGDIKTIPFIIYHLPRILETILLCVSKTSASSKELSSDFYNDVLILDNNLVELKKVIDMPLDLFHPPSRIVIQTYYENFDAAQKLLEKLN